ncbi:DNA-binding TFAR19-related protein [Haladaptatus litoreus]|uniref:DNA-binding protein SAMN05421858_2414 n=1 Tax=Haladaptatus litoreus TaxID=553468 RepID=A0A1N7B988_9EURY|nr:DNA-binding protein [Haladaptatus litoreus]SIR47807.1 DNA-binding TFAR19-related protein [Haladaptatus litoreus]
MSGSPDDDRLEELRKKKMEEMQDQKQQEEAQQQAQQQADAQKKALLRQYLTDGARKRLNSVRMSKPQFAEQVEQQILAIAQSGRINGKIDDQKMKELLRELKPDKKSFNIKRR